MDRNAAIAALERARSEEPDSGHLEADGVLVEFIRALGYNDVADAYDAIQPKWYA